MTLLDTRKLYGCGANGEARIYEAGVDGYTVEVANDHGAISVTVAEMSEAYHAWLHPFDRERGLDVPQPRAEQAYLPVDEHYLYVALESVEAGDSDTPA